MLTSQTKTQRLIFIIFGLFACLFSLYVISSYGNSLRSIGDALMEMDMFVLGGFLFLITGISMLVTGWRVPVERRKSFDELRAKDFAHHKPAAVTLWLDAANAAKHANMGAFRWGFVIGIVLVSFGGLIFYAIGLLIWLVSLGVYLLRVLPKQISARRLRRSAGIDREAIAQALG